MESASRRAHQTVVVFYYSLVLATTCRLLGLRVGTALETEVGNVVSEKLRLISILEKRGLCNNQN